MEKGGANPPPPSFMDILIASDIFGHTPALDRLAARLKADRIHILSPHDREFTNEARAYEYFTQTTDIPAYAKKIKAYLKSPKIENRAVVLAGFSIGATAIWQISADSGFNGIQRAFCFYGSRIRDHREICPAFPMDLIFPESEPGFDVAELMKELAVIPGVSCIREESGLHGFMNRESENFSRPLYLTWTHRLNQWMGQKN
ncbi:hypothetical protein [Desulfospira joergensenii]|uniref:hypothetical protein n=1 Tax=Desulfospira joergensenii TaxID=53329 RepID=UPI0003B376D3|nr:hypothetical protein [Desulfospira joergensenii]